MSDEKKIIRVFPRRTKMTPDDDLAFVGDPPFEEFLPKGVDEVHISVCFTWDLPESERLWRAWKKYYKNVYRGGPGRGEWSYRFVPGRYIKEGNVITTRGCNKKCRWCLAWRREGAMRTLPIKEGYNVLDNNLLAAPREHIEAVFEMLRRQKERIKFTGGLDSGLLEDWHIELLKSIRLERLYLAYDEPDKFMVLAGAAEKLQAAGYTKHHLCCYVMAGYGGDSVEGAEQRLEAVTRLRVMPFVMLYQGNSMKKKQYEREWIDLAGIWNNR